MPLQIRHLRGPESYSGAFGLAGISRSVFGGHRTPIKRDLAEMDGSVVTYRRVFSTNPAGSWR